LFGQLGIISHLLVQHPSRDLQSTNRTAADDGGGMGRLYQHGHFADKRADPEFDGFVGSRSSDASDSTLDDQISGVSGLAFANDLVPFLELDAVSVSDNICQLVRLKSLEELQPHQK